MSGFDDRLTPEGRRFLAQLEKMSRLEVRVGYQAGAATYGGVDICDIVMWNELGTSTIPARPFLRQSVDQNEAQIRSTCAALAATIAQGGTAETVLNGIGNYMVGVIQDTINHGSFVPNAPSTIRQKNSDQPLIDTERMRQSVHFQIKPKDGS